LAAVETIQTAQCLRVSTPTDRNRIVRSGRYPGDEMDSATSCRELIDIFQHADLFDRLRAARFLKDLGPGAAPAVPVMIKALNEADERIRLFAATVLGSIGKASIPAAPALVRCLVDVERHVADAAQQAVLALGKAAMTTEAFAALEAMAPYDRKLAVERLGPLAAHVKVELPDVFQALSDFENGKPFDKDGRFSWEELVDVINRHRDRKICKKAVAALGAMGDRARGAVPFLINRLNRPIEASEDFWVIEDAMKALAQVDVVAAIPELLRLGKAEPEFWSPMLELLAVAGPAAASAAPELRERMHAAGSVESQASYAMTLWEVGDYGADVFFAISALLAQPHASVFTWAHGMRFLKRSCAREFIPNLIRSLETSECGDFVGSAAQVLGNFGASARAAIPDLERIAKGGSHFARLHAAVAIHEIDPSSSIPLPALVEMVAAPRKVTETYDDEGKLCWTQGMTQPRDRARVAEALGSLGPAAKSALATLRLVAEEEDEQLRTAALAAIAKIENA
jgi:HEAT repeat protein